MANSQTPDGTTFKQDLRGMGNDVGALKADLGHLAHGAADAARSGVAELRHGAEHAVETAKVAIAGAYEGAKKSAPDTTDSLRHVVARNPVASIGIAAGVGLLIGLVLFRPRS